MKTFHPIADTFPLMLGAEYEALKRDIAENGLLEKIRLHRDGSIIDGRNRYRACVDVGVEPEFTTWDGDDSELLDYVLSVNLHRRHLTASQRAVMALEVEAKLAKLAKKRQAHGKTAPGKRLSKSLDKRSDTGKAAKQAADLLGTNKTYVAQAKKLALEAPDLLDEVREGNLTTKQATTKLKKRKKEQLEKKRKQQAEIEVVETGIIVEAGQFWHLGKHTLFVGDTTSDAFQGLLTDAALAFADPPYGATNEKWDRSFFWEHDYLIDIADIVAVTPGIVNIQNFLGLTTMPYVWMLSTWIKNGMTRGAVGYGNHIPTLLFSNGSVYRRDQDFAAVTISAKNIKHKGQKPAGLMDWIIGLFTKPGDIVVDPFAGTGQTLLSCERLGRTCITGEIDTEYCKEIILTWQTITGQEATNGYAIQ